MVPDKTIIVPIYAPAEHQIRLIYRTARPHCYDLQLTRKAIAGHLDQLKPKRSFHRVPTYVCS